MAIGGKSTSWKHGTHGAVSSPLTDFSLKTMEVNLDRTAEQKDATCFQASYRAKEAGFKEGNISATYHYDETVYAQLAAIFSYGDSVDFEYGHDGTATSDAKITGAMVMVKLGTPAKVGDVLTLTCAYDTNGAITDTTFS